MPLGNIRQLPRIEIPEAEDLTQSPISLSAPSPESKIAVIAIDDS
jgi:hypothetical protein